MTSFVRMIDYMGSLGYMLMFAWPCLKLPAASFCNYDDLNTGAQLTVKVRNEMQNGQLEFAYMWTGWLTYWNSKNWESTEITFFVLYLWRSCLQHIVTSQRAWHVIIKQLLILTHWHISYTLSVPSARYSSASHECISHKCHISASEVATKILPPRKFIFWAW